MNKASDLNQNISHKKTRLLILASGEGTLFQSIAQACKTNTLAGEIIGLISNKRKSPVLNKAQKENIPMKILDPKDFSSFSDWDQALCDYLKEKNPDLIVLAGFFKKVGSKVLSAFESRVLSIHPSLLPLHGGPGMYGINVHRSVIASGDKKTGTSIHLVHEEYDTGPVLAQKKIPVSTEDSPESLQEKVKKVEQTFYPLVLQKIITGEIQL